MRAGTLADNVNSREIVPGPVSQARHLSLFFSFITHVPTLPIVIVKSPYYL